jgi:hypothetical protein
VDGELDRVESGLDELDGVLSFRIESGIREVEVSAEVSKVGFGRGGRGVVDCCWTGFAHPISLRDRLWFEVECVPFAPSSSASPASPGSPFILRYQSLGEEGSALVYEKLR